MRLLTIAFAGLALASTTFGQGVVLSFVTPSNGSLADSTGQGTGFRTRLPGTGSAITGNDPTLVLNAGSLATSSTASDLNGAGGLSIASLPGIALADAGIGLGADFIVAATFSGIQYSQAFDQLGIYVGESAASAFRGGLIINQGGRNAFTSQTVLSGNVGIDQNQQFYQNVAPSPGAVTLTMYLARISGVWTFYILNQTNPALSGPVPVVQPIFLNPSAALVAGIFNMNSGNTGVKTQTLTQFAVTGLTPTSINFAGSDATTHGAWRTPRVTKALDGDANNVYGSDGYVLPQINATTSLPGYIASVTNLGGGAESSNPSFLNIDNPQSAGQTRSGLWFASGTTTAQELGIAQITVAAPKAFRLGILISNADYPDVSPDSIRVRQQLDVASPPDSGLIPAPQNANRDGDWYFFDILGNSGDVFVISGTNARNGSPVQNYNGIGAITFDSFTVTPPQNGPTISAASLPAGFVGKSYGPVLLTATGGSAPYRWSATGLPQGVTISSGGIIGGTPTVAGSYAANVVVTDAQNATGTATFSITINTDLIPLTVTGSGFLGSTSVGKAAGTGSFTAGGGKPPYSWSISGVPAGITLNASGANATVSGTPTQAGVFNYSVTVSDSAGQRASAGGSVSVLGLNTGSLPNATAFAPYSASLSAVGGAGSYSFTVTGLPSGLSVTGDGQFRGSAQKAGSFTLGVTVTDGGGNTASGSVGLQVDPAPVLTLTGTLGGGTLNVPYSGSLAATGGAPPYAFSVAGGALPDGLRFSASGGLSGTPAAVGNFSFAIRVTDASGGSVTGNYAVAIAAPPVTITTPSPLPTGMATVDYPGQTFGATGGVAPFTFTVKSGTLPGGMTLSAGGQLSGVPAAAGTFAFTVTAKDTTGNTGDAGYSIVVRPAAAELMLSTGSVSFSLATGSVSLPGAQTVQVQSTDVSQVLGWTAGAGGANWLNLSRSGGSTPGSFAVSLTSAAQALTASGSPYSATITVTCATAVCAGKVQTVTVTLNVQSAPAQLTVSPASLAFTGLSTAPAASSQDLTISNTGGGTLGVGSVICAASWCKVSGVPALLNAGATATLSVTADPGGLAAGYYWSSVELVTSGGKASVPVTFFIAPKPTMLLAPSGFQAILPAGGTLSVPATSFNITVSTPQTVNWAAAVTGASWLKVSQASGSAGGSQPATVGFTFDTAALAALSPGAYYNSIRVTSDGVINSPQDFTVVVNVTAATDRQKPNPSPAGLLFLTAVGSAPPDQRVNLYSSSSQPEPYQASASTETGGGWLSASPSTGTTSPSSVAQITVKVDPSKLTRGVYRGQVDFAFAGNAVRSVNVTLVVQAIGVQANVVETSALEPRAGCSPTQLVPAQTGLVNNFSAPTSWPTPLEVVLVNDCGDFVPNGQIVATFSNGDPVLGLTLADPATARYSATWTPRKSASQVVINAQATAAGLPSASIKLAGAVTPTNAPVLNKDAVLNIYNPVGGVPTAPGTLVSIKGSYLASQATLATTIPLPTTLGGTKVIIGGVPAPISSVSAGQVNVQVPFELKAGQPYQVVISANGALTTPDGLQVADTSPGLSLQPNGFVVASHQAGGAVTEASPAKPGEIIAVYLAGMGLTTVPVDSGTATTGPSTVAIQPDITIGGVAVTYQYAGLTPGLVGVYQINLQVPDKTPEGNQPFQLSQAGAPSNSGLLPVKK